METKNFEKLQLITKKAWKVKKLEEKERKILSDLKELDISNGLEINKKYMFNELIDFFEKRGYFMLYVSMLKNDFTQKFLDSLKKKYAAFENEIFLSEFERFLVAIAQSVIDGKEFLLKTKDCDFSEVFFIDDYGNDSILHGSLNINFTDHTQYINVNTVFEEETNILVKNKCKLKRLILYDNGHKSVIIENNSDKQNYLFMSESSLQLVINRFNEIDVFTITLDITSGEVINAELKINDKIDNPLKILHLISKDEKILINNQTLLDVLVLYLENERELDMESEPFQSECVPLKTLIDLKKWIPPSVEHVTTPLRKRAKDGNHIKTLVCHDMKGGYLEDRYINGAKEENCYSFVHWAAVDIFCYFSHHLVTIPPCSWISAAHVNGVQVIGTFITEWDEGARIFEKVFADKKTVFELCMKLINIAAYYNFDGWLINIENKVKPCQIPLLKYFLRSLTNQMHAHIPGSQVIWYDSVLKNGELRWQSCLNDLNRVFFLNVDGIFLNYNWFEEELMHSKLQACERSMDVYAGVDVFGRGKCFSEGGFSTSISVKEARKHGLSAAIFAPGWVYETLELKDFQENQFKFWDPLQELIPPRIIEGLPYCSSFCPGFGNKMFRNGKVIDDNPWYNMNLQQPQPVYFPSAKSGLALCSEDAFNGGGCLCFSGSFTNEDTALEFYFLKTSFRLENACLVSYTFKPSTQKVDVGICLDMISADEAYKLYLVDVNNKKYSGDTSSVRCLTPAPLDRIAEAGYKIDHECVEQHWIKRVYLLDSDDFSCHSIQNISVVASCENTLPESVSILLGEIEILPVYPPYKLMYENLTCKCVSGDSSTIDVECFLKWQHHSSIFCHDIYVQPLNQERQFICTTNQAFYNLKCTVNSTSEMAIILCPKTSGSENLPNASIKIPLIV